MQGSSSDAGSHRPPGWEAPEITEAPATAVAGPRPRRHLIFSNSPLARRIVTINLLGLVILVIGVFYVNPVRESLAAQRLLALRTEAELIADILAIRLGEAIGTAESRQAMAATFERLNLPRGSEVFVFALDGTLLASATVPPDPPADAPRSSLITDLLNRLWVGATRLFATVPPDFRDVDAAGLAARLAPTAAAGVVATASGSDVAGNAVLSVAVPVSRDGTVHGVVAVASAAGEIDRLVRAQREQVLRMFVVAILVSIGLSLVLASTIANPLADLARAAENGRSPEARRMPPARVRIPDLTERPDEIGRLSGALRGMVAALYDRIDANEQFAADVAHEIKNPLASLRSAVGTMRLASREDQREMLLEVIEHDVRRLDRLVSDISNASRLDSELVKEEEERFDLLALLTSLSTHHGEEAGRRGIKFVTDLPEGRIEILGLEARLAQVFVNLITNALSFCEEGDAIRIWVRRRGDRVLVVFEDTGPGIPEAALTKIFERFYSERPAGQFGDHSGLGLAISKQIVEAHGGVIWAENIRPTDADITSEPLGARIVVGLPL